jgi:gluconokinase
LTSQFDTLEPLGSDERGLRIDVDQSIDSIVETYVASTEQENR